MEGLAVGGLSPIASLGTTTPVPPPPPQPEPEQDTLQIDAQAVNASRSIQEAFTIVTKEGDKVTLSGSSRFELGLTTYNASGRIQGADVNAQGQSLSLSSSRELSISVEGDLSEEELRDIRKLVRTTERLARDFARGDLDAVAKDTRKLSGLDSLASFQGEISISQSLSVAQLQQSVVATPANPSAISTQADSTGTPPTVGVAAATPSTPDQLVSAIRGEIQKSGIDPKKLIKPFEGLFSRLAGSSHERGEHKHRDLFGFLGRSLIDGLRALA